MIPVLFRNSDANVELVESSTLYEVAPDEAAQERVAVVATPVAPLAGVLSTGAAGGAGAAAVVNLLVSDQPLVPPAFVAFTLQ